MQQYVTKAGMVLVAILVMTACSDDGGVLEEPRAHAQSHNHPDLTTGEELFEYHCSVCHGKGWGNFLKGIPAAAATTMSQGGIAHKLRDRRSPDSPLQMPQFTEMSPDEAYKIAAHVKQLQRQHDALR